MQNTDIPRNLNTSRSLGKLSEAEFDAIHNAHFPPSRYVADPQPFSAAGQPAAAQGTGTVVSDVVNVVGIAAAYAWDRVTHPADFNDAPEVAPAQAEASTDMGLGDDDYGPGPLAWLLVAVVLLVLGGAAWGLS